VTRCRCDDGRAWRNPDGTATYATRPESEWVRFDRPELRIVSAEAWTAAHSRLASSLAHIKATVGGRLVGQFEGR
jgi:hypothetical protein